MKECPSQYPTIHLVNRFASDCSSWDKVPSKFPYNGEGTYNTYQESKIINWQQQHFWNADKRRGDFWWAVRTYQEEECKRKESTCKRVFSTLYTEE